MSNLDYIKEAYSKIGSKKKYCFKDYTQRIQELSRPKIRLNIDDELVGPGRYDYLSSYLLTIKKSPRVLIGRSERFLKSKIPKIRSSIIREKVSNKNNSICCNLSENITPCFTFKRTGHNLRLVENPDNPGAGSYTPRFSEEVRSYSFTKAQKNFNWKKGNCYSANLGLL